MAVIVDRVTDEVLTDVKLERVRQYEILQNKGLWDCADPATPHPNKMLVLTEEVGEVANCILEAGFGTMTKKQFDAALYRELIQVAAVAVAFAESVMRETDEFTNDSTS